MDFLKVILKIVLILATVLLMALPLVLEFYTFRRDKDKKITYKRFRILDYTFVYVIVATLVMYILKETLLWLETLKIVKWLVRKVALSARKVYYGKILVAALVNFAIGLLYRLFGKFVRIGLKKKNLVDPKKKDGSFNWRQKAERAVIKFFHNETWFFVKRIVFWLSALLSGLYALLFILFQIPAMFGADWLPFEWMSTLFGAGYVYPTLTLLPLWEIYFFLRGIERLEEECPELLKTETAEAKKAKVDLDAIDQEVKKQFGDFYSCDVNIEKAVRDELASTEHNPVTEFIAQAVERDQRNPQPRKEPYLDCLDTIIDSDKSVLINGNFFSEFSMYFFRYLSAIIARGDNVVFVCNSDTQISSVYDYLSQGLSEITSLYCKGFKQNGVDFDDPLWRIVKVSGDRSVVEEAAVDESNVLVTSLSYLCSSRFETEHSRFITMIDAVVFVDALNTVNMFNRQLGIINTHLKHLVRKNSLSAKNGKAGDTFRVRYMSRRIRYFCFDDTRTPGLDKVFKNKLAVELETVDSMNYSPTAKVRCYNFEGKADENGITSCPQFFNSREEVGVLMNVAALCLAKGAGVVNVFADNVIPYGNIRESIAANLGQVNVNVDENHVRLNKCFYNPDDYSVLIVMDSGNNLPATVRKYVSMVSEKPTLILAFSKPYMLRDYFCSNVDDIWVSSLIQRIPVEDGTAKDVAQRVFIKAGSGGITKREILQSAEDANTLGFFDAYEDFGVYVKNENLDRILMVLMDVMGIKVRSESDLFHYFEYLSNAVFDESGKISSELKIVLRRQGELFETINRRNMVVMVAEGTEYLLPMPRGRLTQNYIAGQNLIFNGNIYHIQKIDTATGRIYARLAVGGINNEAYQYIQDREYRVDVANERIKNPSTKHTRLDLESEGVSVTDVYVSTFSAPVEVITSGYYQIDPHTLARNSKLGAYYSISDPGNDVLAKQTYRRYGEVVEPFYSSESVMESTDLFARAKGTNVMSIRVCGAFGENADKTVTLASVMLNELIQSMFPSVADSVVVCPVLGGQLTDEEAKTILQRNPKVKIIGESEMVSGNDFNLLIIEDSPTDLGVVSVLMSGGDNVLHTLFGPIFNYLKWYTESENKSDYLYYGLGHEPSCFDFASLLPLSKMLGYDNHELKYVDLASVVEYEVCDFCGKRYVKGDEGFVLDEAGRKMCAACARNLVGNDKKTLKAHLERAKIFLESTYGITLEEDYEFCFESTLKIANTLKQNRDLLQRGADVPLKAYVDDKKKVHVEYSIPSVNLSELLVRELTHVWQLKHLPTIEEELAEGHIALVAVQYLHFLNQDALASVRTTYYETTENLSGLGYRKLVKALLENPQYSNNPFRYLLDLNGGGGGFTPTPTRVIEDSEFGKPYVPQQPDRVPAGEVGYFCHDRLSPTCQKAYDVLLNAIANHEEKAIVDGCTFEDVKRVCEAIEYDHPELFWYRTFSMLGTEVSLVYGASAEECAVLQRRIDEIVPQFLQGIDDTMSAYDVVLRTHVKVISMVDYDTIALNKEKEQGGPAIDRIDYLRSICGVFLEGKAVCEGYARAMQYLLQKCGIECAEVAGFIRKENGENGGAHAWNIVKIDGDYYYLDTTWDDSSNTIQTVKVYGHGFDYFCVTTDEMSRTRDFSLFSADLPVCTATRANYYVHNDLVLDAYDLEKIKAIAGEAARNAAKFFTFKCGSSQLFEQALAKLCAEGTDCYAALKVAAKADKKIRSDSYTYSYDKNIRTVTVNFKYK